MQMIDMETWPRREHFKKFSSFNHPHFGMTANVDLTLFHPFVKQQGASITVAIAYVLSRTANGIPEFRQRIHNGQVVEHDIVHPSITVLGEEDLFGFCMLDYMDDFSAFATNAAEKIAYVKGHPTLQDPPGQDNLLFMTVIPWVSFTSFMHPMQFHPEDSVPRFAWGKLFEENKQVRLPLGVWHTMH
jgi:chloramphenicol O-acetyltransferase type A